MTIPSSRLPADAQPQLAVVRPRAAVRPRRVIPAITHAVFGLGWLALAALGSPYYRLDYALRQRHEWHAALKPTGELGLAYGYLGTAFLLLLLLYSVRKRVRFLRPLGALRNWLDVHILCGLMGPAFITLHAGFRVHGVIAVGYWAMLCVMMSGFVGYYLYSQLPRAVHAQVRESELLAAEIAGLDRELVVRFGLTPAHLQHLHRISGADRAERMGTLHSLFFLLTQDLLLNLGLVRLWRTGLIRRGRHETKRLRHFVRRRLVAERRRAFLHQTEQLFGYWHTIHKPFAIILYTLMIVHIGIAVWLGYAWAW